PLALAHDGDHATADAPPDARGVTHLVMAGEGANTYQSVPNWCQIPEGRKNLGSTHGGVVVDKKGQIYFSMDGGPDAVPVYVADGYGQNWVHVFDKNQKYVKSFGGKGKEPGQFQTCHGIALDKRGGKNLLLIADRENRRLQHFDLDGKFVEIVAEKLRRPCSVSFMGDNLAVAELEGRVAIIDGNNKVVATLGDNPDKKQWATNRNPPESWKEGLFNAPHGISYDHDANLLIEDWNVSGRVYRFNKTGEKPQARAD